jgi:hypothetical protein
MQITVFNDTCVDWGLHAGSERGINGERDISKHGAVVFEVPDGSDVFVKVWGRMAMVRYGGESVAVRPVRAFSPGHWEPHPRIGS